MQNGLSAAQGKSSRVEGRLHRLEGCIPGGSDLRSDLLGLVLKKHAPLQRGFAEE